MSRLSIVVLLLALVTVAVPVSATGARESGDAGRGLPRPEESLTQADESIRGQRYDDAIPRLVDAVRADDDQLPAAEVRFEQIRQARLAYIAKGREVEAELRELIAGDIGPQMVIPTAFEALRLIAEMTDILPFPNPEERELITELQSRVLLTIDRRRFDALMRAASEELDSANYVRAVEIYVDGLGEYGFELSSAARDDAVADGQAQIAALLETDGIAIQIGSFNPADYELTGPRFATARDTIRRRTVSPAPDSFATIASPSRTQAQVMIDSFAAGDFDDAQGQIADYLPLLRQVTDVYRTVLEAGEVISELEALNASRAIVDEAYRYNWHIRFVADIVLGRPDREGARRPEGVLHAVERVWDYVANGPVEATRAFGAERYADASATLLAFDWAAVVSPGDDAVVSAHVENAAAALGSVAVSYRTAAEILNVSRSLGLDIPEADAVARGSDLIPLTESVGVLGDGGGREEILEEFLEALAFVGSSRELDAVVRLAQSAYQAGSRLVSQSSVSALTAQRSAVLERIDGLSARFEEWEAFAAAVASAAPREANLATDAAPDHADYIRARIDQTRRYDVAIVRRISEIGVEELNRRLSSQGATVNSAASDLAAVDPLSDAPRPRAAQARDRLRPLVGTVTGTRVVSTATGTLEGLRNDAAALAEELRAEPQHVRGDDRVQGVALQAEQIASTVGTRTSGLLANAVSLLEQSLRQIATGQELEQRALERVSEVDQRIDEAQAENAAGNVLEASFLLDQADRLLSSNDPQDASNLFTASLENWYRPELERQWDEIRERLSDRLNDARRDIVLARVDLLAADAAPLLDPPPGEDARPGEAIMLLEEADALWSTVYPLIQNPVITPLLRRARILQSQQQQVLSEEVPGFERLSQTLNTARVAFQEGDFGTARQALSFFLGEQPLNAEARLLDIRLELETGQGSPDAIVRGYVNRSLDEVTEQRGDAAAVESAILNLRVSDDVFNNLLPLRSKLLAIEEIIVDRPAVSAAVRTRIDALLDSIEVILNPPPPPAPPNPRLVADDIIDGLVARGDWENLPVAEQTEIYEELVRVTTILPGYERATQLIRLIQSYLPTVRTPTAAEQAIMTRATRLVQQGDFTGALAELERYQAVADRDPMLIPDWRNLYNDLIRRLRRQ